MKKRKNWARGIALLMALGLFAAACGDDGGSSNDASGASGSGTTSGSTGSTTTATPQKGGSITVSVYSESRGLDPASSSGSGTAGGTELISLYDTMTRWNPETRKYDMRTAESVTPNADFSEWTVKLKPGIKFRDGTAYDADAVKYNSDRYMSAINTSTSRSWLSYIVKDPNNVTVLDPLTVKYKLAVPYSGFPAFLAHTPGMILSPTKLKALGDPTSADYKAKYDAFNLKPEGAGAGAFEIVSFQKGDSITVKADPNFYGGAPYLDQIKFIVLSPDKAIDALKTGTVNVGFLRSAASVDTARNDKSLGGIDNFIQGGDMLLMNQGVKITCTGGKPEPLCVGQPDGAITTKPNTADPKVRQAVALAIDPAVINTRVSNDKGIPSNAMFDKNFTNDPGVPGIKPDPAAAKKLVDEAKAAGYSGNIRVACTNAPDRVALAQTLEPMLRAAGFNPTVRSDIDVATQITQITTQKDFDLGCWGLSVPNDDTALLSYVQNFWSASPTNRVGYNSPAFDAALNVALGAKDDAARKVANKTLAELWNKDLPSLNFGTVVERIAWQNKVHGVYPTESSMFILDKAWVEK